MPVETRKTGKIAVRGDPSGSDPSHLSPSPPRTSEPQLATSSLGTDLPDPFDRVGALEFELSRQKQATNDLIDMMDALRGSIDVLSAPKNASSNLEDASNIHARVPKTDETQTTRQTAPTPAPARNRIKPGTPPDFDGNREKGRAFLNSCRLYITLCASEFADDQAKIHWVLSYMKSGRASSFADRTLRYEDRMRVDRFTSWNAFREAFVGQFCPVDEATHARVRLEGMRYFQGRKNVEEYVDEFEELVDLSEYNDDLAIVMKFRRGLDSEIQNKIAESRVDRPADDDIEGWFEAAKRLDRNRLANEAFNGTTSRRPTATAPTVTGPSLRNSLLRLPAAPTTVSSPSTTRPRLPNPTTPYLAEAGRSKPPMTCFRCNDPGHTIRDCPKRFDVRALSTDELQEIVENRLAALDVARETIAVVEEEEAEEKAPEEDFAPHDE
jgi:hypothetical protein